MEYYNDEIAKNNNVEVVWVTADRDEDAMEGWAKKEKFPWPTVKFKEAQKVEVFNKVIPRFVPAYVMVDAEGKQLAIGLGEIKKKIKEMEKEAGPSSKDSSSARES